MKIIKLLAVLTLGAIVASCSSRFEMLYKSADVDEKYKGANIIMTDIFLWACTAIDPNNLDYGLPGEADKRVFVSLHESIIHGGMSNALVYGYQKESLINEPYRFLVKNRKGGVLEAFMNPIAIK